MLVHPKKRSRILTGASVMAGLIFFLLVLFVAQQPREGKPMADEKLDNGEEYAKLNREAESAIGAQDYDKAADPINRLLAVKDWRGRGRYLEGTVELRKKNVPAALECFRLGMEFGDKKCKEMLATLKSKE